VHSLHVDDAPGCEFATRDFQLNRERTDSMNRPKQNLGFLELGWSNSALPVSLDSSAAQFILDYSPAKTAL